KSVKQNVNVNRTSFNGPNGIKAEPTAEQRAAAANAKKVGPTSQQLSLQQAASKDQNLRASVNKGHPNNEAIKSFNKNEGAGQGKGAQGLEAAGGAAGAGSKPGNLSERQGQGAAAGAGKSGNEPGNVINRNHEGAGPVAGAGKVENDRAHMAEHDRQGAGAGKAGAGQAGANGNNLKTANQGNRGNIGGNPAKMHTGKIGGAGGPAHGEHTMNQQMARNAQMDGRNPQMKSGHPQMGGQPYPKMQGGGNRPHRDGQQQQGKKKPDRP
ncbi:MAG: hypothetical protein DMF44_11450, partial [Verrucomicrobia bacterium]